MRVKSLASCSCCALISCWVVELDDELRFDNWFMAVSYGRTITNQAELKQR